MTTTTKNIYCSAYLSEFPVLASREHVGVSIVSHEDGIHPEVTVTDVILVEVVIVIVIVVGGGGLALLHPLPIQGLDTLDVVRLQRQVGLVA